MNIRRFAQNPIITPDLDPRIGTNINGPSLIRVPDWVPGRLGRYYLYFAHHQGTYIRLAYADALAGPWRTYAPGVLDLDATPCIEHIASPDVHVDEHHRRIILYFHGPVSPGTQPAWQRVEAEQDAAAQIQCSFVATSTDGLTFTSLPDAIGPSYLRAFTYEGWTYALTMPGLFLRSRDGLHNFAPGPRLFDDNMRHAAVRRTGNSLHIYYSTVGDVPEQILWAQLDLRPSWDRWQVSAPVPVLWPATDYEGVHLPLAPSVRGAVHVPVCQLRDPAIFEEAGRTYLLYSVAGEQGIAIAEIETTPEL